ncbi:MAG: RagB/SusD family nutrient uptake outer membrane protein [Bacteroidota bacterium]|nr:RagB/SusD family nutrient uptake outer membrane protein [Bacteroidota bacterium]
MKTLKYFLCAVAAVLVLGIPSSCTKLDEKVYSDIPLNDFFHNEKDVLMNAGRAYTKLQHFPEEFSLWSLDELASDEMVAPARDDGMVWDNGRWNEIQKHQVTSTNKILSYAWTFVFEGISACNEVIYETEQSPIQFSEKDRVVAEIKVLRAYFYYLALDNWGNIPFTIDYTDKNLPVQKDRKYVFNYIENEVLTNVSKLKDMPTSDYYGRITQGAAYTLLAKLYLNAQEWIGVDKFQAAVDACDKVINLNAYSIEDDYFTNFAVHNENSKENIFVIPMNSIYTKDRFYWYTLTLNDASRATFGFKGGMWDEFVIEPDFYTKYADNDLRRKSFLVGQQKDADGNDIYVKNSSTGQLEPFIYTYTIDNYMARKKWEGARFCKYAYQNGLEYDVTDMENDFVIFRYADVLYTKLEALWRMGRAAEMINDPGLQKIRTRAGLQPLAVGDLTNDGFLDELGREFVLEVHRRQDMIRFGAWTKSWWNKPVTGPNDKLFPIPQTVLNANHNIVQNP